MDIQIAGLPWWLSGKESSCQCRRFRRHGFNPWVGKFFWRRKWQPASVFLPEKSHGQRSLTGCSPWGHKESNMTDSIYIYTHSHTHTHTYAYTYTYTHRLLRSIEERVPCQTMSPFYHSFPRRNNA